MKNVLLGFFHIAGYGTDSAETPLVGNPTEEHARLRAQMNQRHPESKVHRLFGTVIENRENPVAIETTPGMTIAQLFRDGESLRTVGRVYLAERPYDVVMAYQKAAGSATINLRGVLSGDGNIRMSEIISTNRLVTELPTLITASLGKEARELKLHLV